MQSQPRSLCNAQRLHALQLTAWQYLLMYLDGIAVLLEESLLCISCHVHRARTATSILLLAFLVVRLVTLEALTYRSNSASARTSLLSTSVECNSGSPSWQESQRPSRPQRAALPIQQLQSMEEDRRDSKRSGRESLRDLRTLTARIKRRRLAKRQRSVSCGRL